MKRLLLVGVLALAVAGAGAASGPGAAGPISGKLRITRDTVTSTNWSGYAAYGTTFTDVKGSWVQPAADCSSVKGQKTTIAAFWAGLDGYTSGTVEQTGTESDCVGKTPVYFAWYEFYPAGLVALDQNTYPVVPGDTLTAEVSQDGDTVTVNLDSTNSSWPSGGKTVSMSAAGLDFSSAEWIMEAPRHSLTDFGSVDFSGATASDANNTDKSISSWSNDQIDLVNHWGPHGSVLATPSALGGGGKTFTITE
jgi:hypothetical protein